MKRSTPASAVGAVFGLLLLLASLPLAGCPALDKTVEQDRAAAKQQAIVAAAVPVEAAGRTYWAVLDTLDDLPAQWDGPQNVLYFFTANPGGRLSSPEAFSASVAFLLFPPLATVPKSYLAMEDQLYDTPQIEMRDGRLAAVKLVPMEPTALMVLDGINLYPSPKANVVAITQRSNRVLLSWKSKELPGLLQSAPATGLQDLVVKLESALLDLDARIKRVKDAQDEAARHLPQPGQAGQAPPQVPQWQVEQAHLFSQRKAIIMACLEMVKKTLANKRGGG